MDKTITINDDLARRIQMEAVRQGTSFKKFLEAGITQHFTKCNKNTSKRKRK